LDAMFFPPLRSEVEKPGFKNSTEYITWMFAKMHLASSDSQVHEMVTHLGTTHLALEPICIATFRNFAEDHRLFLLLKPHTRQTIAINELGRRTLLNPDGFFDSITALGTRGTLKLIQEVWRTFNFSDRSLPRLIETRGFKKIEKENLGSSEDILPGYLYRDYGFMVWDALKRYTASVIDQIYKRDEDVKNDIDLQRWAFEIGSVDMGNLKGFPDHFHTKKDLIETVTTFIFTASAQHSAVNFGQFDFYGFIPYRPLALTQPMPENVRTITWEYVMSALPNLKRTLDQMTITYLLSRSPSIVLNADPRAQTYLGSNIKEALDISESYWKPYYISQWKALDKELREAQEFMVQYNNINGYNYRYLYYDDIAMSIAI